jgi:hypothetical protein
VKLNFNFGPYQNSPHYWDGIPLSHYLFGYVNRTVDDKMRDFLSVQTMRTLFNDRLAGFLKVPYLSSAVRTSVHSVILRRKVEIQILADKLLACIGPEFVKADPGNAYMSECSAPFILGLILEKMTKPEDFWNILKEYRERFAPLRKRMREDRAEWGGRSGQYLRRMLSHLSEFAASNIDLFENAVGNIAVAATTCATASKMAGESAKLAVKLIKLSKPASAIQELYWRIFKPEIYLLSNLADEAKRLRTVENRIVDIWGAKERWGRREHDQLTFLASAHQACFPRLRNLG